MGHELLQIGAGRIGRGLVGDLFQQADYHVRFVDVDQTAVDLLNQYREYPLRTVSPTRERERTIRDVDAVSLFDQETFTKAVIEADVICTAVGSNQLPSLAPHLAHALVERTRKRPQENLHAVVIAAENAPHNTTLLRDAVFSYLSEDQQREIETHTSFTDCMVDRIVSGSTSDDHPLLVTAEEYHSWKIDGTGLKEPFDVPGIEVVFNLQEMLEQKILTVNTLHLAIAQAAYLQGYTYIHEGLSDRRIRPFIAGTAEEICLLVDKTLSTIDPENQRNLVRQTLWRFANPPLQDTVDRVARNPLQKLTERLVKPALLAMRHNVLPSHLALAIVNALHYDNPNDEEAQFLQKYLRTNGIELTLKNAARIRPKSKLANMVKAGYNFAHMQS